MLVVEFVALAFGFYFIRILVKYQVKYHMFAIRRLLS